MKRNTQRNGENVYRVKGGELELHDFDGPIKLGKRFKVTATVYVDEVKARDYEEEGRVRTHIIVVDQIETKG